MDRHHLFRIANFRRLFFTRLTLGIAQQMQVVAVGWQIYALLRDPLYLGLIGLAEAVPAIGLSLYAGHVIDRGRPERLFSGACLASLAGSLVLLLVSLDRLGLGQTTRVAVIFAVIFGTGIARAFIGPAHFAMTARSLTADKLRVSAPWMSGAWQVSAIAGPALGGVLYAAIGVTWTFAAIVALGLGATLIALRIALEPVSREGQPKESLLESVSAGLRFVFGHQVVFGALLLDMLAVFFGGATSILPMYVDQILHAGPMALGALRAAPSAGSVLCAFWLIYRPPLRGAGRLLLLSVAGFGVCMILFGLSRSLPLSFAALFVSGVLDNVSVNVRYTLLQLSAPDDMRGRVAAVNSIFLGSSNELGEFESGVAARLLGLVPSVVLGGCATLVVVAALAWHAPRLRRLDLSKSTV